MFDEIYRKRFGSMPAVTNRLIFDFIKGDFPEFIRNQIKYGSQCRPISMHHHDLPEFIYIYDGQLDVRVNGNLHRLNAGDLIAIDPYSIHSGTFVPGCDRLDYRYMIFSPSIFSGCKTASDEFDLIRQGVRRFCQVSGDTAERLGRLMESIGSLLDTSGTPASDLMVGSEIWKFMAIILGEGTEECQASEQHSVDFIRRVGKYLESNLSCQLTTSTISSTLGYNRNYFCSLFKQNFGLSFSSYLCEYRIRRAAEKFKGTDKPLSEIALDVGFTDYCYFSRCFTRIMGVSPSKYFRTPD